MDSSRTIRRRGFQVAASLLVFVVASASCKQTAPPFPKGNGTSSGLEGRQSLFDTMQGYEAVEGGFIMLDEATFLALRAQWSKAAGPHHRTAAARLGSRVTASEALGLVGVSQSGWISGSRFLVARDWWDGPYGWVESVDFYVATVDLDGYAQRYIPSTYLLLNTCQATAILDPQASLILTPWGVLV